MSSKTVGVPHIQYIGRAVDIPVMRERRPVCVPEACDVTNRDSE